MTWKIWLLSAMAPKGQFTRHMTAGDALVVVDLGLAVDVGMPMASMPQAAAQGRSWVMMA